MLLVLLPPFVHIVVQLLVHLLLFEYILSVLLHLFLQFRPCVVSFLVPFWHIALVFLINFLPIARVRYLPLVLYLVLRVIVIWFVHVVVCLRRVVTVVLCHVAAAIVQFLVAVDLILVVVVGVA